MTTTKSPGDGEEDKILADFRTLIEKLPPLPPTPLGEWNRDDEAAVRAVGIAWGWLMRTLRTAEAIRSLEHRGFGVECAPLRRSVVEHVIRLHWATTVDTRRFVEAALNKRKHSLGNITLAAEAGTPLPDGALDIIELLKSEADPGSDSVSFKDLKSLMNDIPDYQILFQIWLTDTQESHATLTSSEAYVEFDPDEPGLHLHMEPTPNDRFRAMLPSMVLLGTEAFVHLAGIADQLTEPLADIRDRVTQLGTAQNSATVPE
ncbi:hypothetical protein M707_20615 [Arthrobacter sp. AK-YN10]|nr:hypothetical protein M707_20615 [Arthrobacter sp. AK-YN10]